MGLPFIHRHSTWGLRALRHIVEGAQLPTAYLSISICMHTCTYSTSNLQSCCTCDEANWQFCCAKEDFSVNSSWTYSKQSEAHVAGGYRRSESRTRCGFRGRWFRRWVRWPRRSVMKLDLMSYACGSGRKFLLSTNWNAKYSCIKYITSRERYMGQFPRKWAFAIYIKVIKIIHVWIAISSERYTPLTSYFHHFILHHFSMVKYFLGSCTCSVPVLQRPIPHRVWTRHNFRQE